MPSAWSSDVCSDRKSTRLNSSHTIISYAVFCLKKKYLPDRSPPRPLALRRPRLPSPLRAGELCVGGADGPGRVAWTLPASPTGYVFFFKVGGPPRNLTPSPTPPSSP